MSPTITNADSPAEARGLARDDVRLLTATPDGQRLGRFHDLPGLLQPGDVVVVNTSPTRAAALDAARSDGSPVVVHVAEQHAGDTWVVEVRPPQPSWGPVHDVRVGEVLALVGGGALRVVATPPGQHRLHEVRADVDLAAVQAGRGRPVAYGYVPGRWPLEAYQTVFSALRTDGSGSAEMPSAARPFTPETVAALVRRGVLIAHVVLDTGVSSLEAGEHPRPERFDVPLATAALVNQVRAAGGRVVAVGTTVTRALESVAVLDGTVHAGTGWTGLVLGPERPARVVTGLVTGWHEPGGSHVDLLEAVAGHDLVAAAYATALREGFLWHEFGDSCLLLP